MSTASADDRPTHAPFTGFSSAALGFYAGLEADNSKTYWTDHKAQ